MRMAGALAAVVLIGVAVLWAFYGFRYAARPARTGPFTDAGCSMSVHWREWKRHGILFAAKLHLLPESWLYGLADVRAMANGMPSYFFGKVYAHGVWFYFPVLFTIKSTLGMLGLLLLTCLRSLAERMRGKGREVWFLVAPPALYLLVAMGSHLNIGARHILPIWVFCCVIAGAGAAALIKRSRRWAWAVAALLVLHAASSIHAAPNYISYANEAWGGPKTPIAI